MVELALVLSVYRFNYDWIFGFLDLVLSILISWLFLRMRSPGSFVLVQLFEVSVVVAVVVIKVCHIIVIQLVLYLNRQWTKDIYKLLLQIMSPSAPSFVKLLYHDRQRLLYTLTMRPPIAIAIGSSLCIHLLSHAVERRRKHTITFYLVVLLLVLY